MGEWKTNPCPPPVFPPLAGWQSAVLLKAKPGSDVPTSDSSLSIWWAASIIATDSLRCRALRVKPHADSSPLGCILHLEDTKPAPFLPTLIPPSLVFTRQNGGWRGRWHVSTRSFDTRSQLKAFFGGGFLCQCKHTTNAQWDKESLKSFKDASLWTANFTNVQSQTKSFKALQDLTSYPLVKLFSTWNGAEHKQLGEQACALTRYLPPPPPPTSQKQIWSLNRKLRLAITEDGKHREEKAAAEIQACWESFASTR